MMKLVLLILTVAISFSLADNNNCLKCHGSPTFKVLDSTSGKIRDLSVVEHKFLESNHKNLKCETCHSKGFEVFPHKLDSAVNLNCVSCHTGESQFVLNNSQYSEKFKYIQVGLIYEEFKHNFHTKVDGLDFDCATCHNPHEFNRSFDNYKEKIASDNGMCRQCHDTKITSVKSIQEMNKNLDVLHAWLPNPQLHWESVRCIDCHSSYEEPNLSHRLLKAEESLKNCESCHSENSVLLTKLYKHELKESRQKYGFINGTLISEAYVIGSTRNEILDKLSVILFALTIFGIIVHGGIRLAKGGKKNVK